MQVLKKYWMAVVIAVLLVLVVALFAQHWGGDFEDATISGSVEVYVHQWLDATLTTYENDVYDYGELGDMTFGSLEIDSNAPVNVEVQFTGALENGANLTTDHGVTFGEFYLGGTSASLDTNTWTVDFGEVTDGTYMLKVTDVEIDKDLQAGTYKIAFDVIFNPTVRF